MLILPAVVVGGLVVACLVFYTGFLITHTILSYFTKRSKFTPAGFPVNGVNKPHPVAWKESDIDKISLVGGGIGIGLVILLLFSIQKEQALLGWVILTFIGLISGLLSFVIFDTIRSAPLKGRPGPGGSESTPPRPGHGDAKTAPNDQARQEFMIVVCVNCAQKLRIPRQKKKLIITCPKCRASFPYTPGLEGVIGQFKKQYRSLLQRIRSLVISTLRRLR
jgi:hypothetical protein